MTRTTTALVGLLLLVPVQACSRRVDTGPPELRLGRDECAECGMSIHDERSAAACLIDRDGQREYLLFDDIGCLLDLQRSQPTDASILQAFVHDHPSAQWLDMQAALFLVAPPSALRTPMGSGIAAFQHRDAAEEARLQYGGEILDRQALADWRKALMEARRKPPGP